MTQEDFRTKLFKDVVSSVQWKMILILNVINGYNTDTLIILDLQILLERLSNKVGEEITQEKKERTSQSKLFPARRVDELVALMLVFDEVSLYVMINLVSLLKTTFCKMKWDSLLSSVRKRLEQIFWKKKDDNEGADVCMKILKTQIGSH